MTKVVTPSSITAGQIGKLQELLGAALRKSAISGEAIQHVIEQQGDALVGAMLAVLRSCVVAQADTIVRRVRVNPLGDNRGWVSW